MLRAKRESSVTAEILDRTVIAVEGPEARRFLQGLITNDVEKVAPDRAIYAALLTPQGKILFDFMGSEGDGALLIDCATESSEALMRRLSLYRLRSRVTIGIRDQLGVFAAWNDSIVRQAISFADPRITLLRLTGARLAPLVTHRLDLEDAPDAYRMFRAKEDECMKVVLKP